MKYEHFVGLVQRLAELPSNQDALNIIRATLETLSERLAGEEAEHIASQLPKEIGNFMRTPEEQGGDPFPIEEFFDRVSRKAETEIADAVHQVRAVTEVLKEAVDPNELEDMYAQLPYEYRQLFDAGPMTAAPEEEGNTEEDDEDER